MDSIYKLRDMLCDELAEYGKKTELKTSEFDFVDKLAHTIKNLDKIIETEEGEGEYSGRGGSYGYGGNAYRDMGGMPYRGSYGRDGSYDMGMGGNSYARGRRNAKRDSRGRYSRENRSYARNEGYSRDDGRDDMIMQIEGLMQNAPTPQIRQRMEELASEIENA